MNTTTLDQIEEALRIYVPADPGNMTELSTFGNRMWISDFGSGLMGVVKVADAAIHGEHGQGWLARSDEGVWLVSRGCSWPELVPVTVKRRWPHAWGNPRASVQLRMTGFNVDPAAAQALGGGYDGQRLAVLDYLVFAHDRHFWNVMVSNGRLVGIDNQVAFTRCARITQMQSHFWAGHAGNPVDASILADVAQFVSNPPPRLIQTIGYGNTSTVLSRAQLLLNNKELPPFP